MAKAVTRKYRLRNRTEAPKKVWIVRHVHRHGTDVAAFANRQAAYMGASDWAMMDLELIEEHDEGAAASMKLAYAQEDYETVVSLWGCATENWFQDTYMEIEDTVIKEAVKNE